MEDDVGAEALHDLEHPLALLAVGEHRFDGAEVPLGGELPVDLEEVVLGLVDEDEQPRPHPRDLARELGADRAPRTGDEDDLVAQVGADGVELHPHGLAAEHVLDLHLAELLGELDASPQQLEDGGQRADADAALAAGGDDLAADRSRGRGDRDHHLLRLQLLEDAAELLGAAEHLDPEQAHPLLAGVVVDEPDRAAQLGVEPELTDDHLPAGAGADDEHVPLRMVLCAAAHAALDEEEAGDAARGDEQPDREDQVVDHDRARHRARERLDEHEERDQHRGGDAAGADHRPDVAEVEVTPPLLVQAHETEDRGLAQRDEDDRAREHLDVAVGDAPGLVDEADLEREVEGQGGQRRVRRELEDAVPEHRRAQAVHDRKGRVSVKGAGPAASGSQVPSRRLRPPCSRPCSQPR